MIKSYFKLLLVVLFPYFLFAQNNCENANSRIVAAYSHVKKAYSSNNISDLKYYSERSIESFRNSKNDLKECGCETAYNHTIDALELLVKVAPAETYEDGRFFVKRARDIAKQSMIEIDECSYDNSNSIASADDDETPILAVANNNASTGNSESLNELRKEQLKLKQQQDALKAKEDRLKLQLISEQLKKNKALIEHYNTIIASNITTFNKALSSMSCSAKSITPVNNTAAINLEKKNANEISGFYKERLKTITNNYLLLLNECN